MLLELCGGSGHERDRAVIGDAADALAQVARAPPPMMQTAGNGIAAPVLTDPDLRDSLDRALDKSPKKYIALLGSTGSIGTQTLDICREYPEYFEVISIAAGANVDLLSKQIAEFKPKVVGLAATEKEAELRERLKELGVTEMPEIVVGEQGQTAVAVADGADTVVTGVVGVAGLLPTIEAIKLGRTIALANKETLIAGGPVILPLLKKYNAKMYKMMVKTERRSKRHDRRVHKERYGEARRQKRVALS